MIRCPLCWSGTWKLLFKCLLDPANDKFECGDCGYKFKRYSKPSPENQLQSQEAIKTEHKDLNK